MKTRYGAIVGSQLIICFSLCAMEEKILPPETPRPRRPTIDFGKKTANSLLKTIILKNEKLPEFNGLVLEKHEIPNSSANIKQYYKATSKTPLSANQKAYSWNGRGQNKIAEQNPQDYETILETQQRAITLLVAENSELKKNEDWNDKRILELTKKLYAQNNAIKALNQEIEDTNVLKDFLLQKLKTVGYSLIHGRSGKARTIRKRRETQ